MVAPELEERLNFYLQLWAESEAAARVDAVESNALVHGFEPYQGQTIPELIAAIINDLLLYLAQNPKLLESVITQEQAQERVNKFLKEEQEKIDTAAELVKEMRTYWFGPLDPRYRRASERYSKVVKSFRIVDKDYNLTLPPVHELKD